jgi:PAS domain-containing protein
LARIDYRVEGRRDRQQKPEQALRNVGAERMFGYTAEEAIGKPVLILSRGDEEPLILDASSPNVSGWVGVL